MLLNKISYRLIYIYVKPVALNMAFLSKRQGERRVKRLDGNRKDDLAVDERKAIKDTAKQTLLGIKGIRYCTYSSSITVPRNFITNSVRVINLLKNLTSGPAVENNYGGNVLRWQDVKIEGFIQFPDLPDVPQTINNILCSMMLVQYMGTGNFDGNLLWSTTTPSAANALRTPEAYIQEHLNIIKSWDGITVGTASKRVMSFHTEKKGDFGVVHPTTAAEDQSGDSFVSEVGGIYLAYIGDIESTDVSNRAEIVFTFQGTFMC